MENFLISSGKAIKVGSQQFFNVPINMRHIISYQPETMFDQTKQKDVFTIKFTIANGQDIIWRFKNKKSRDDELINIAKAISLNICGKSEVENLNIKIDTTEE